MKKLLFLPLVFLLWACTQEELTMAPPTQDVVPISAAVMNDYSVTIADIDNLVSDHNPVKSRSKSYTISTINDANGQPCIYVINFGSSDISSDTTVVECIKS